MITLSKVGDSIVFTFENNPLYLNDGTIEVPVNSLSLVIDESDIATFKKSASNDIFLSCSLDELGMTKEQLTAWYAANAVGGSGGGGGGISSGEAQTMIDQSISGKADSSAVTQEISAAVSGKADIISAVSSAEYVSSSTTIDFKNADGTVISSIDASDFIVDGMVDDVKIETISGVSYLVIDFNTASGKEDIQIPLTDIFDPSNYYTKSEIDQSISGKADSTAVTQEISAAVSGKVNTSAIVSAVTSGSTNSEIPTAKAVYDALGEGGITSAEVQTMINQSISGKMDTSVFDEKERVIASGFVELHESKVETSAITSSITSGSTDAEIPSAKAVYDALGEGGITSGEAQTMIDQSISGKADSSAVTQEISAATSGKADTSAVTEAISAAVSGKADSSAVTEEISAAVSGKADSSAVTEAISAAVSGKVDTSAITTSITSLSTDVQVPSAKAVYDKMGGLTIVKLTQQEYDDLLVKDSNTLYVVV